MLQHYVFLKYREETSDGHITAFCERMLALRGAIGEIRHLEIGRDELHDARSWDLVLIMEFASVDALRAYQRHPEHRRSWPSTIHSWRTWRRWTLPRPITESRHLYFALRASFVICATIWLYCP